MKCGLSGRTAKSRRQPRNIATTSNRLHRFGDGRKFKGTAETVLFFASMHRHEPGAMGEETVPENKGSL